MAFCNKIGSLMRRSIAQSGNVPVSSMLNAIRGMSSNKLYIGGLSYGTSDDALRNAFCDFGDVVSAKVITDRDTGRSRGFGFVDFTSNEAATSALSAMDGQELDGRSIRVSYANERSRPAGQRSFNNSGRNGGFHNEGY